MRMTINATTATRVSGFRQDAIGTICVNRLRAGLDARYLHFGLSLALEARSRRQWLRQRPVGIVLVA